MKKFIFRKIFIYESLKNYELQMATLDTENRMVSFCGTSNEIGVTVGDETFNEQSDDKVML